jgi:N-acetylneuraminate synthase
VSVRIGPYECAPDHPPLVIAEMSGNHNGSLDRALAIVEAAAAAGAHAVKLQTYTADTMTLDLDRDEFVITDPGSPWAGRSLYQLYREAHTPWEWHAPLFQRARDLGLVAFSTPFDASAVEFLETLAVPCYKIASFENTDLPLIRRVAATGKPLILSTGMATQSEITDAVDAARAAGCRDLVLLKCTSSYPAPPEDSNLASLPELRARFKCQIGLSDHTPGIGAAVAAVALGAVMIEKHFTLARADGGVDAGFSLEPEELARLVEETARAHAALGRVQFGATGSEQRSRVFRRSLYVTRDLPAGAVLTAETVRAIRPGLGLPPACIDDLIGRRLKRAVRRGTPASWDLVE